jgi:O-acetylserine/cysteine efflux transporter
VLVKRQGRMPMLPLMAWLSLVPPLPAIVVAWLVNPAAPWLGSAVLHASTTSLLAVVYIGLVATTFAYAVWGRLLTRYPASMVAPFALLAPCTGVLASALVFGERFGAVRCAGMALIVAGLACVVLPAGAVRPARPLPSKATSPRP